MSAEFCLDFSAHFVVYSSFIIHIISSSCDFVVIKSSSLCAYRIIFFRSTISQFSHKIKESEFDFIKAAVESNYANMDDRPTIERATDVSKL